MVTDISSSINSEQIKNTNGLIYKISDSYTAKVIGVLMVSTIETM